MDTKTLVNVQIFGHSYTIRGEADQEYILGVASLVDRKMREVTEREGVVLIYDEVITGFRHDLGGVQKVFGVRPT
jgi:cell division protein ZapA (FtsZ GTPase activity inhibitor)